MKKILRFDSVGGASGDMVLGALLELCKQQGIEPDVIAQQLARLIPEPFHLRLEPKASHGVSGTMLTVELPELPEAEMEQAPSEEPAKPPEATPVADSAPQTASTTGAQTRKFRPVVVQRKSTSGENHGACHSHTHDEHGHHHEHHHVHYHEHGHHAHSHGHAHHGHTHSHDGAHVHRSYADIRELILHSDLTQHAKELSLSAFQLLAEAEGRVHGMPVEEVHFHEVGATDSIIDTVGACVALDLLNIDGVSLSPIPVGGGTVVCAHGTYPVPAPAVVEILKRNPFPTTLDGEACEMLTPTGATLLATWKKTPVPTGAKLAVVVHSFGHREMRSRPNLLRVSLYEAETESTTKFLSEELVQLDTNIDDMTGEQLAAAMTALFTAGALDVWFTAITMKKNRPGVLLNVLCQPEKRDVLLETLFRHARTFGVREQHVLRHALPRRWETVETDFGPIRVKIGSFGTGETREDLHFSPEFEDCRAAAEKHAVPVCAVMEQARCTMEKLRSAPQKTSSADAEPTPHVP